MKILTLEEAKKKVEEGGSRVVGELVFDEYLGWIDKDKSWGECGYIILCWLNEDIGFCPKCEHYLGEEDGIGYCNLDYIATKGEDGNGEDKIKS